MFSKKTVVLGSTGSIGRQTVELLTRYRDEFDVVALVCNTNIELLADQVNILRPRFAVVLDESKHEALKQRLSGVNTVVMSGVNAAMNILSSDIDVVILAIAGFASVEFAVNAVKSPRVVGIASKESIVCAWQIIKNIADANNAIIIPIDSEHNSISQVIGNDKSAITGITLTASGGPFCDYPIDRMENVTVAEATRHPVWNMGQKISIDSATLMNKALEMIEAKNLFEIDSVHVLIHRESTVHCLVEFCDGFCVAGICVPDMKIHIAQVLGWPRRLPLKIKSLNLGKLGTLRFSEVDTRIFPSIRIARVAMEYMGNYPVIMNAANEEAVKLFVAGRIKFTKIVELVEFAMEDIRHDTVDNLEAVIYYDNIAREKVASLMKVVYG